MHKHTTSVLENDLMVDHAVGLDMRWNPLLVLAILKDRINRLPGGGKEPRYEVNTV